MTLSTATRHSLTLIVAWMVIAAKVRAFGHSAARRQPSWLARLFSSTTSLPMTRISVSDAFDGGNGQLVGIQNDGQGRYRVRVRIRPDVHTELEQKNHLQYFCFRATVSSLEAGESASTTYILDNAAEASYPSAWKGTTVFCTHNLQDSNSWRRKLDTHYQDGQLTWTHDHASNGSVYFSYFPTYSYGRHLDLVSKCTKYANVESLGQTLEGREIECISVGSGCTVCWIIHRQHPGENMAEYYAEGLLNRLLGLENNGELDGSVRKLLQEYTFYIVPCMCIDGAVRGHLRTNSVGANLNREWADTGEYKAPTLERSPEVYHVLRKMDETGVDCFLDIHGDEELPFNFLSGAEGTNHWGPRLAGLHGIFLAAYERANSDIQRQISYPPMPDGKAGRTIATNAIANRFNCLSATLEMPFKDCLTNPDPEFGWSPNRARMLGAAVVDALSYVRPFLRNDTEFWETLPEKDAYVRPTPRYRIEDFVRN